MGDIQFVASLNCLNCSQTAPANTTTDLVSNLLTGAGYVIAQVGDELDIGLGELEIAFLVLREPNKNEKIQFLESWTCPHCWTAQWAKIILCDWFIEEITTVVLNEETLNQTHYISDYIQDWLLDRFGKTLSSPRPNGKVLLQEIRDILAKEC